MINDLNTFVSLKVDGIVLTPTDARAIAGAVTKISAAKIPVVIGDVGKTGPVNALLLSDNFKGGQMAMDFIAKQFEKRGMKGAKVGLCTQPPANPIGLQRNEGFKAEAKKLGYPVASEVPIQNMSAEGGFHAMQQMMVAVPDVAGFSSTRAGRRKVLLTQSKQLERTFLS